MRSALVLLAVRVDYNTLVRVRYVAKRGTPVLPRVHKSPLRPHDTHAHTHPLHLPRGSTFVRHARSTSRASCHHLTLPPPPQTTTHAPPRCCHRAVAAFPECPALCDVVPYIVCSLTCDAVDTPGVVRDARHEGGAVGQPWILLLL
jgi:hypothetical protein